MVHTEDAVAALAGHLDALWVDPCARPVNTNVLVPTGIRALALRVICAPLRNTLAAEIVLGTGRSSAAKCWKDGRESRGCA